MDADAVQPMADRSAETTAKATVEAAGESTPDSGARGHLVRCLGQPHPQPVAESRVSLEAEVPEALFDGMRAFLRSRPEWDQYRLMTSALAGFLFQNGCSDRSVAQHYLDGLFMRPGA